MGGGEVRCECSGMRMRIEDVRMEEVRMEWVWMKG